MIRPARTRFAAIAISASAAFGLALAAPATAQDEGEKDERQEEAATMTKGEKQLAKLLEGRVAGEPQNCIRTLPTQQVQTIEGTAYVYGRGNTIYVQRTRDPDSIDRNDALVTRRFNASRMCRQDVTRTIDPVLGFFTGAVFFEDFIPYTRVEDSDG